MKKKMFIAGMSLAVALILLATASFAWLTMSTAPEAKGMNMTLYTDRTLLLAPGDGTNTAPASDEFKQYISLSSGFAGLAPLRPVSTADGINWYLPAYSTEGGGIGEVSEFVLDNTLEHGNVSLLDANGNYLTDGDLQQAVNKGYYVYTDFWLKTGEDGAKVRLSIPYLYGTTEERHAGIVPEYGLYEHELQNAVYGTYVLGEPELDSTDPTKLAVRTEEPETALRVGFLVYQDTETLNPITEGIESSGIPQENIKLPFKIYEPNADKRAGGVDQNLIIPDANGSAVAKREDYIVGSGNSELDDSTYYVTQPIAKAADGGIELTTVSPEDMIVQLKSEWDNTSVIRTLNGQWGNSILKANSNDVKTFGQFLKTEAFTTTVNKPVPVSARAGMTDIAGSNVIVELKKETPIRVRLFVWLEGQDVDCWNDIATGTFRINLELAGETVYREEEEEPEEPAPLVTCTLKGYGTNGNSSDGWFDSAAAGIARSAITEIEFTDTIPTGWTKTWNAGQETGDAAINAYLTGTKVSVVLPEGADRIMLPENSSFMFQVLGNCHTIGGLENVDTSEVTEMRNMFNCCPELTSLDVSGFDTAKVTNMNNMFGLCRELTSLDVSGFDTSKVTDMGGMFSTCNKLTSLDVSGFDTSKVTNMGNMFKFCNNLTGLDVSGFDTSSVTDMNDMFGYCGNLTSLDVSGFDTSSVTNMYDMFYGCGNLTSLDVSGFDTSKVTNMRSMFGYCSNVTSLDVSGFDTLSVTDMVWMFGDCTCLTTIYAGSGFTTSNVTADSFMFTGCTALVGGNGTPFSWSYKDKTYARIDTADTPGYFTDIADKPAVVIGTLKERGGTGNSSDGWYNYSVAGIEKKTITELEFTKTKPADYSVFWNAGMGTGAEAVNAYLTGTKVTIVIPQGADKVALPADSAYLFSSMDACTSITGLQYIDTSEATSMWNMFYGCKALTSLDLSGFNTAKVTSMGGMFSDCSSLASLDLSSFDTSHVRNMSNMFNACRKLKNLDLSNFTTLALTNAQCMFRSCGSITSLDLSGFVTPVLNDAGGMFYLCISMQMVDLSNFDASNVSSMSNMFYSCNALTTVYVGSDWDLSKVTKSDNMFANCNSIFGGNGTVYCRKNANNKSYAHIDKPGDPGYFTKKGELALRCELKGYGTDGNSSDGWFDSVAAGISRNQISAIEISKTAPNTYNATWNAGTGSGVTAVNAYRTGTKITIVVPAVAEKIYFPVRAENTFYNMPQCSFITGLENINASANESFYRMFAACPKLTNLDLSSWDTRNARWMHNMFEDCSMLQNVNVSNFDVSSVGNLSDMFCKCSSLTSLDLSGWNTQANVSTYTMFAVCVKLKTIYVGSDWSTYSNFNMFYSCTEIVGGNGTTYDGNHVDGSYARIDTADTPGYFTAK